MTILGSAAAAAGLKGRGERKVHIVHIVQRAGAAEGGGEESRRVVDGLHGVSAAVLLSLFGRLLMSRGGCVGCSARVMMEKEGDSCWGLGVVFDKEYDLWIFLLLLAERI